MPGFSLFVSPLFINCHISRRAGNAAVPLWAPVCTHCKGRASGVHCLPASCTAPLPALPRDSCTFTHTQLHPAEPLCETEHLLGVLPLPCSRNNTTFPPLFNFRFPLILKLFRFLKQPGVRKTWKQDSFKIKALRKANLPKISSNFGKAAYFKKILQSQSAGKKKFAQSSAPQHAGHQS